MRSAPWLSAAARWIWVLPLIALWFARGTDRLQTLVMTLVALLGFVLGRARASSDEARRALLHAQDRARESSRATRSRIADIDEERAQSIRMATLGERTRIAREIHDNVGHLLTRAIMQAQAGKTVAKATNDTVAAQGFATLGATLDDAMTMVRRSVHDLEDDGTDFAAQIDDAVTSFDGISPGFAVTLANDIAKVRIRAEEALDHGIEGLMRIAIVDDDPIVCQSLETILTATGTAEVLWMANDGDAAVRRYFETPASRPDVLLIDIQMPGTSGLDAAREILATDPAARILFLTTFADQSYIAQAMGLGAKGYLIKQDVAAVGPALQAVMAGQVVLGAEVLGKLTERTPDPADSDDSRDTADSIEGLLGEREREITALVAEGLDNRDIAARLFLSEGTVRNRISAILDKLGLTNRTQLAILWLNAHR